MASPLSVMVDLSLTYVRPSAYNIKRKPAPTLSLEERYPPPDPLDPFAPLSDLRKKHIPSEYKDLPVTSSGTIRPPVVTSHAFSLLADPPSPSVRPPTISYLSEGEAGPSRPPRSPFRNRPYGNRSLSTSNLSKHAVDSSPSKIQRHTSQGGVEFNVPEYGSESSPTPSLVADGQSDSSEGDGELPSPKSDLEFGPDEKGTGSKKMFQRLLGKKSSGGALLPLFLTGAKVSTPGPRRHSTTAAFASSNPSSPTAASFLKQPLGVTLESAALQETLAKLNGVEANLGVPKGVSPINSFSARGAPLKERPRLQDFSETNHSAFRSPTPEDDDYLLGHSSPPSENADDDASLTLLQFTLAACIPVVDALGMRIPFAELINVPSASVVFIRHWNCPSSQSYIRDVIQKVPRGRRIIIIGNGSHSVIPKYRKACLIPDFIEVYTEPSLRIHRALGLRLASEKEINKSEIKKNSSLAKAVVRALKSTAHYGPLAQLGGEFHFKGDGNSLVCTYAHRMENTKDHGPIHAFVPSLTLPFTLNNRNSNDSGSSADRSASASPDIVPPITQLPSFITT